MTDIRELLIQVAAIRKETLTPLALGFYVNALENISVERLQRVFAAWFAVSGYFPFPSELVEQNAKLPFTAAEQERVQQKLLAKIDWNPKQLPSFQDEPEQRLKLAAPSADLAAELVKEKLADRAPVRQLTGEALNARLAELERQRQLLLSQARVTDLRVETERVVTRALGDS